MLQSNHCMQMIDRQYVITVQPLQPKDSRIYTDIAMNLTDLSFHVTLTVRVHERRRIIGHSACLLKISYTQNCFLLCTQRTELCGQTTRVRQQISMSEYGVPHCIMVIRDVIYCLYYNETSVESGFSISRSIQRSKVDRLAALIDLLSLLSVSIIRPCKLLVAMRSVVWLEASVENWLIYNTFTHRWSRIQQSYVSTLQRYPRLTRVSQGRQGSFD